MRNTIKLLRIAARASSIDTEKSEHKRIILKTILNNPLLTLTIEYKRKGTLKAIDAAVMFLLPATPFKLKELKEFPSS